MRPNKFTVDQIIKIMAEAKIPDSSIASVSRKQGIIAYKVYKWKEKYKGLYSSKARRLKALFKRTSDILEPDLRIF